MPDSGAPGQLRQDLSEELTQLSQRLSQDDFHAHATDLSTTLTAIKARTRDAAMALAKAQQDSIKEAEEELQRLPEWAELSRDEQSQVLNELDGVTVEATEDLAGIKKLLNQSFVINSQIEAIRDGITKTAHERQLARFAEEREKAKKAGQDKLTRSVSIPATINSTADLEELIHSLQAIKAELAVCSDIEVTIKIEE